MHARKTVCFGSNFVSCFLTPQWANSLTYPIATQSVAVSPTAKYVVLLCSVVSSPFEKVRNSARLKATGCSDSQIAKNGDEPNATLLARNQSVPFGISKAQLNHKAHRSCKKFKSMTTRMGDASTFCRAFGVRTHAWISRSRTLDTTPALNMNP